MKTLLPFLAIFISTICLSQAPYVFSSYSSDYMEIQDGIPIDIFDLPDNTWDDPEFTVPLDGFDIMGQNFNATTQISVGALMGFLEDNGVAIHGFGLDVDIIDGAVIEGDSASEISYIAHITPEFTSTIIQFSNVAFYEEVDGPEPGTSNRMNFQIQFDTPSNGMTIHFGPSDIPDPELVFYGESGPTVLLGIGVNDDTGVVTYVAQLTGDPANPTLVETFDSEVNDLYSLSSMPQSGQVYHFEPAANGLAENQNPLFSLNPTLATDYIRVMGDIKPNSTYHIFDLSGKEIQNGSLNNDVTIDVSSLQSGAYLFSINGMASAARFLKTE